MEVEAFGENWRAFGGQVREVDGHDLQEIEKACADIPFVRGRPSCVVAHTIKGKGVSFMEHNLLWHYRTPVGEEYDRALVELTNPS